MKQLTEEVKATVMKDLGLTKEELEAVLATVTTPEVTKTEETKTALKEEKVEEVKKEETPTLEATVAALTQEIETLKTQLATAPTVTRDEILKSLATAPKGDITKTTEKGPELTAEEKVKLDADLEANKSNESVADAGYKSFYDRFTSK